MKKNLQKILVIIMSLILILLVAACGSKETEDGEKDLTAVEDSEKSIADDEDDKTDEIKENDTAKGGLFNLGAFLQLTGGNSAYGMEAKNSVELAVKQINEAGGLNGQQINLIVYDTQGSPEEAVKVVQKMIESDNLNACIGSINSAEVLAAAGFLNDENILTLGLGTSPNWMEEDWPYVFRPAMNNNRATPIVTSMIKEDCGIESVAIFKGQDDASLATSEAFVEHCEEVGIEVLANESYDLGDTDFSAQVANMLNTNPQTVYISTIGETGPVIVRQLRQAGYTGIIFDKESFMISQIEIAGEENADYIAFANPYVTYEDIEDCDIDIVREFLVDYSEMYGELCKTDSAYRGYDAMLALNEATKISGSNDSDALKDAMSQVNIPGLGGQIDFTIGDREAYETFNSFILIGGKNILWENWLKDGGYDEYKELTNNEF